MSFCESFSDDTDDVDHHAYRITHLTNNGVVFMTYMDFKRTPELGMFLEAVADLQRAVNPELDTSVTIAPERMAELQIDEEVITFRVDGYSNIAVIDKAYELRILARSLENSPQIDWNDFFYYIWLLFEMRTIFPNR